MADYTSPKPVDPIWYQPSGVLRITCRCGRREIVKLKDFANELGLPKELLLHRMISRLRCKRCKQRPTHAEVTRQ